MYGSDRGGRTRREPNADISSEEATETDPSFRASVTSPAAETPPDIFGKHEHAGSTQRGGIIERRRGGILFYYYRFLICTLDYDTSFVLHNLFCPSSSSV